MFKGTTKMACSRNCYNNHASHTLHMQDSLAVVVPETYMGSQRLKVGRAPATDSHMTHCSIVLLKDPSAVYQQKISSL